MTNPYQVLGLKALAETEEIRAAYHKKALQWHPDRFQDPEKKEEAHQKMIELNLAYEEALKLASVRQQAAYRQELSKEEAVRLAHKMLDRDNAPSALRQLNRSRSRDAAWYETQGQIYMVLEQYENAEKAFRQAVRLDPENNVYRAGALDASVAARKAKSVSGILKKALRNIGIK